MCDYCEKMKRLSRQDYEDGTYMETCICPVPLGKKGPYIYIEHMKPIEEHYKTGWVDGIFINYCPMCGRNMCNE